MRLGVGKTLQPFQCWFFPAIFELTDPSFCYGLCLFTRAVLVSLGYYPTTLTFECGASYPFLRLELMSVALYCYLVAKTADRALTMDSAYEYSSDSSDDSPSPKMDSTYKDRSSSADEELPTPKRRKIGIKRRKADKDPVVFRESALTMALDLTDLNLALWQSKPTFSAARMEEPYGANWWQDEANVMLHLGFTNNPGGREAWMAWSKRDVLVRHLQTLKMHYDQKKWPCPQVSSYSWLRKYVTCRIYPY